MCIVYILLYYMLVSLEIGLRGSGKTAADDAEVSGVFNMAHTIGFYSKFTHFFASN